MKITKDKVKRTAILGAVTGAALEYVSAAGVQSFDYIKNYQFDKFWETINYNLSNPIANITNALSMDAYTAIQPLILAGTAFVAGKFLLSKPNKYEDASHHGAYGTSRFASQSEIFHKDNITSDMKKPGTILGMYGRKPIIQHADSHMNFNHLIVGGSGAGKTRSNIIPNILKNKDKSIVVIDPKGELYEMTSEIKREQGYEVHLVNYKDRDTSDRYNLFHYIRSDSDAFKVADAMVSNAAEGTKVKKDFWNQAQTSVLQALILYVKHALPKEQQHMGSVYNLASSRMDVITYLFTRFPREHIVRRAYQSAIANLGEKTGPDVFITLMQTLNPWQYEDVCRFTETNDFLFEELGQKKMIVYVIIPIADNEFRPLITTFFTQLFSELYRSAGMNQGRLQNNVWLALDEFANIGKIPDFETRLSTTRSLGIEVSIIIQDTSQLESRYGKDLAKEMIANCDIRILLKANEPDTAKYFSRLAGKTTIRIKNNSSSKSSKSSSRSESIKYTGRDLINEQEILNMEHNNQLLFTSGSNPMLVKKAWFDKMKEFKNMLGKDVSRADYAGSERLAYQAYIPPTVEEINEMIAAEAMATDEEQEEFFVPFETEDGSKVDTETGEILEEVEASEPEEPLFLDEDAPPEEEAFNFDGLEIPEKEPEKEKVLSVDDLGESFKF